MIWTPFYKWMYAGYLVLALFVWAVSLINPKGKK